jgi:hypothetical protein
VFIDLYHGLPQLFALLLRHFLGNRAIVLPSKLYRNLRVSHHIEIPGGVGFLAAVGG